MLLDIIKDSSHFIEPSACLRRDEADRVVHMFHMWIDFSFDPGLDSFHGDFTGESVDLVHTNNDSGIRLSHCFVKFCDLRGLKIHYVDYLNDDALSFLSLDLSVDKFDDSFSIEVFDESGEDRGLASLLLFFKRTLKFKSVASHTDQILRLFRLIMSDRTELVSLELTEQINIKNLIIIFLHFIFQLINKIVWHIVLMFLILLVPTYQMSLQPVQRNITNTLVLTRLKAHSTACALVFIRIDFILVKLLFFVLLFEFVVDFEEMRMNILFFFNFSIF